MPYLCLEILKINKQMKKIASILVIGAVAFMTSCGPSAKELEEKRIADSIAQAQAEQARKDSIAAGWLNEDGTPTAKLKKELAKIKK